MKYSTLVGAISLSLFASGQAYSSELWQPLYADKTQDSQDSSIFSVDAAQLAGRFTNAEAELTLQVPLPDGEVIDFVLSHDSILSLEMQELYPELQTFVGYSSADPEVKGRFDYTPRGFHGMFRHNGKYVYVEPKPDGSGHYISYNHTLSSPFQDQVLKFAQDNQIELERTAERTNIESRTYRLIVSATGEYSQYHGGTESLTRAAITTAINRVNEVYKSDLAVELELVNFNIYTNAETDPFTDSDAGQDIQLNHDDLIEKFGSAAFDVGHIFTTGGGGLAGLGVVCNQWSKGAGVTGRPDPETDAFYIDYVAHELGHQFGANHTFNGTQWSCSGGNRNNPTAYEPGSGSTIMAYAGICDTDDLQLNSDAYFHAASIKEINDYLATQSCGTTEVLAAEAPVVDAGANYTVPASTPLVLTGSATGTGNLTYNWEQMDSGTGSSSLSTDLGYGPLFRSWMPTSEPTRYLPRLADVIDGSLTKGETYATRDRDMNFRLTVRDGNGGVSNDNMVVTVDGDSGPFEIVLPAKNAVVAGAATVEWNVSGTNLAPVNCSQVDVILSTDGGVNFNQTLLAATNNDGSESVLFPAESLNNARLMVKCSNNIFFAISDAFTVAMPDELRAADDAYTIQENSAATSLNVIANDSGQGALTITGVVYTGSGTVTYTASAISYQPQADFVGNETITYTVMDSANQSATATVTIIVNSSDVSAVNDTYQVSQNSAATVFDILANDIGQGVLTISAVNYSGTGTVTNLGTEVSYQPAGDFSGVDSFTYTITDENSETATATVTVTVAAGESSSSSSSSGGSLNFISLLMLLGFWFRRVK